MRFPPGATRVGAMNVHAIKLVLPVAGWATQGRYAVVEACVEAGLEVPSHVGRREDVVLHVLEGEIEVVADRERRCLRAGETCSLECGVPRRLRATKRSRVLVLLAPAGLEELLLIAADPATDPDDRAALLAVGGVQAVPAA
jgi:quercetin dioxygenase-like cupin family protein